MTAINQPSFNIARSRIKFSNEVYVISIISLTYLRSRLRLKLIELGSWSRAVLPNHFWLDSSNFEMKHIKFNTRCKGQDKCRKTVLAYVS